MRYGAGCEAEVAHTSGFQTPRRTESHWLPVKDTRDLLKLQDGILRTRDRLQTQNTSSPPHHHHPRLATSSLARYRISRLIWSVVKMTDSNPSNAPPPSSDPLVTLHLPSYVDNRSPGSYFPNPPADGPSPFMTWSYVIRILSHGDLDQLFRDPTCDTAYRAFAPSVRAQHNGIENYIRTVRLGWPAEQHTGPVAPNMLDRPAKDPSSILEAASGVSTPNGTRLPVEAVKETWPERCCRIQSREALCCGTLWTMQTRTVRQARV